MRAATTPAADSPRATAVAVVSLVAGLATNHALAGRIAGDTAILGRVRPLEERLAEIQTVTAEDVQRVARTYLRSDARNVVRVIESAADGSGER